MTDYQRIDAVCRKHGWTGTDEVFRYASGRHVGYRTLRKAIPKDITDDTLADYAEDRMSGTRKPKPRRSPQSNGGTKRNRLPTPKRRRAVQR